MVSGFSITRNALRAGYPFVEAILSVLPLCDEFVIADDSSDDTCRVLEQMAAKYGKIKILKRPWPIAEYRDGCLAIATDWAMQACQGDWLIYVQADEVFHEDALPGMRSIIRGEIGPDGLPIQAVQFHRRQLSTNFQECHGEHAVIRMAKRGAIQAAGDALSFAVKDDRYYGFDPEGHFSLFDITRCFIDHFPAKAAGQAEIWWHLPNRNAAGWFGKTPEQWERQVALWQKNGYPEVWTRADSPFMPELPTLMKGWVGKTRYYPLPALVTPCAPVAPCALVTP